MILLIDNYDSFVYNLSRYVGQLGRERIVVRNDRISLSAIEDMNPSAIIISPGPCAPADAGISLPLIRALYKKIPILGVCLGHQAIGEVFGGRTVRAPRPMHGKTSRIRHAGDHIFMGLPQDFEAARYHSLISALPAGSELHVTAQAQDDGCIMAFRHPDYPVFGVQFHPESILTTQGLDLIRNFVAIADQWNETREAA